jgi:hypothetical protein
VCEKRYEVSEIWRKKRERGGEIRTKRGWIMDADGQSAGPDGQPPGEKIRLIRSM